MFVSVTRLHLRSWRFLPSFVIHNQRSVRQVQRSAGFVGGHLAPEPLFGFWTITVWADEQAMRGFRNHAAHLQAMSRLLDWCDEASYTHWEQDSATLPTLETAFDRVRDHGRTSKVRHPSANHSGGSTVANARPKHGMALRPITV